MFSFVTFQDDDAKPIKKKPAWIAFEGEGAECKVAWGGDWDAKELAEEKEKMENELKKMGKGQGKGQSCRLVEKEAEKEEDFNKT